MKYNILLVCFFLINLAGAIVNVIDKAKARHGKWRIPEATLWFFGLIGGATGSYASMRLFHHKTRHKKFMIGMPLLMVIQIGIMSYLFFSNNNF